MTAMVAAMEEAMVDRVVLEAAVLVPSCQDGQTGVKRLAICNVSNGDGGRGQNQHLPIPQNAPGRSNLSVDTD